MTLPAVHSRQRPSMADRPPIMLTALASLLGTITHLPAVHRLP